MHARLVCAVLCCALWSPAFAQGYDELKAQASGAYRAGNYEEAAILFEQAFEAEPRGNLLYNIALCYDKAGNTAKAVAFYDRYLGAVPDTPKGPQVAQRIAELKQLLQGQYEQVSVTTSPPGAIIFVDDKAKGAMGQAPVDFKLLPGTYVVIAELDGYEPAKGRITLAEGRPARVDLTLIPTDLVGSLLVLASEKGSRVSVNGKQAGTTPFEEPLRLRAGDYQVTVSKPGYGERTVPVKIVAGKEQRVSIDLAAEGGGDIAGGGGGGGLGGGGGIWPWVTMGVGVLAVGGGAFAGFSAQDLHDQLTAKKDGNEPIAAADIDTGNSLVLMSNVLYGVGGAAILGGVAWWLFGSPSQPDLAGSVGANVVVGDDGAGVVFGGSF